MIKVTKDFNTIPQQLSRSTTLKQTQSAIAAQNGNLYTSHYKHPSVKAALFNIYHHKCAYCESTISHIASPQVEHYRPKAGVDEQDLSTGEIHKGYYWLGNEWSNLLLACQNCNGQGAKGNRFPIQGVRILSHPADPLHFAIQHQTMLDEVPLLLNPELVDPLDHLQLDQHGQMQGKTIFGTTSIKIYKLYRDELVTRRLKIIQDFVHRINNQLVELFNPLEPLTPDQFQRQMNLVFKKLFAGRKPSVEYSFVYINIVSNFDSILLPLIEQEFQPIINRSFQIYIQTKIP